MCPLETEGGDGPVEGNRRPNSSLHSRTEALKGQPQQQFGLRGCVLLPFGEQAKTGLAERKSRALRRVGPPLPIGPSQETHPDQSRWLEPLQVALVSAHVVCPQFPQVGLQPPAWPPRPVLEAQQVSAGRASPA